VLVRVLALAAALGAWVVNAASPMDQVPIVLDVATDRGAATCEKRSPEECGDWCPAAHAAGLRGHLYRRSTADAVAVEAMLEYDGAGAGVEHEIVRLVLPGPARVLGHDLQLVRLKGELRVDRPTPAIVVTPTIALVGENGIVAAR